MIIPRGQRQRSGHSKDGAGLVCHLMRVVRSKLFWNDSIENLLNFDVRSDLDKGLKFICFCRLCIVSVSSNKKFMPTPKVHDSCG
jgi:hypothetical protein